MYNLTKILAFLLLNVSSVAFAASSDSLAKKVEAEAKRVGCKKPVFKASVEGKIQDQKSDTLVFYCDEFSPDRKGLEKGALVVVGAENQCPKFIPEERADSLLLTDEFEVRRFTYGDMWPVGRSGAYKGPGAKEIIKGKIIRVCNLEECGVANSYVCKDKQWLMLSQD